VKVERTLGDISSCSAKVFQRKCAVTGNSLFQQEQWLYRTRAASLVTAAGSSVVSAFASVSWGSHLRYCHIHGTICARRLFDQLSDDQPFVYPTHRLMSFRVPAKSVTVCKSTQINHTVRPYTHVSGDAVQ
jgi:hypothetical protein